MSLAFFCVEHGWAVRTVKGLTQQLRDIFSPPFGEKSQFLATLRRVLSTTYIGGASEQDPRAMDHKTITALITTHWSNGATKLEVTCTWQGPTPHLQRLRRQRWVGYIDRPTRTPMKGPWRTVWTHKLDALDRLIAFDDDSTYEDRTPDPQTIYYTFTARLTVEPPCESRREARIQTVREFVRATTDKTTRQPLIDDVPEHGDDDDTNDDDDDDSSSSDDEEPEQVASELFRLGHHTLLPVVAHMTGSDMVKLLSYNDVETPTWVEKALAPQTRAAHRRALRRVQQMPQDLGGKRAAVAIAELLHEQKKEKKWTWSTMLKNTLSTQSAIKLLPLYKEVTHGIALTNDVFWQQGMTALQRHAREERPRTPAAMTPSMFRLTLHAELCTQRRLALLLMWFTAGRVGDILQLTNEDLTLNDDETMTVTFQKGKTVCYRGPYTVHTTSITDYIDTLMQHWRMDQPQQTLLALTPRDMRRTYKLVNAALEAKSVRRGALQCMAASGVPHTVLMKYSGHLQEKTLLRYLNWGRITGETRTAMAAAGLALHQ